MSMQHSYLKASVLLNIQVTYLFDKISPSGSYQNKSVVLLICVNRMIVLTLTLVFIFSQLQSRYHDVIKFVFLVYTMDTCISHGFD